MPQTLIFQFLYLCMQDYVVNLRYFKLGQSRQDQIVKV